MSDKDLSRNKKLRLLYTFVSVLISGFLQAAIIQIFMNPLNLLSSGFTGVAILIEKITSAFGGGELISCFLRYAGIKYSGSHSLW